MEVYDLIFIYFITMFDYRSIYSTNEMHLTLVMNIVYQPWHHWAQDYHPGRYCVDVCLSAYPTSHPDFHIILML